VTDFYAEVAKGNVPLHAFKTVTGKNIDADTANRENIWDVGGLYIAPAAGEQLEILSADANDTIAGTGAQKVLLEYLDDDFVTQTEMIELNGVTPVVLTASDVRRYQFMAVVQAGTSRKNEGEITLQVSGGGTIRGVILEEANGSLTGIYTVPDNTDGYFMYGYATVGKNKDADVAIFVTNGDNDLLVEQLPINIYQSAFALASTAPLGPFPPRTMIYPTVETENNNTEISIFYQVMLVERS
jgi:ribosomal protein S9